MQGLRTIKNTTALLIIAYFKRGLYKNKYFCYNVKIMKKDELADYAGLVFGMKRWIALLYADISCARPRGDKSTQSTLRACKRLAENDTGSVDPLVQELAREVLRLNGQKK